MGTGMLDLFDIERVLKQSILSCIVTPIVYSRHCIFLIIVFLLSCSYMHIVQTAEIDNISNKIKQAKKNNTNKTAGEKRKTSPFHRVLDMFKAICIFKR